LGRFSPDRSLPQNAAIWVPVLIDLALGPGQRDLRGLVGLSVLAISRSRGSFPVSGSAPSRRRHATREQAAVLLGMIVTTSSGSALVRLVNDM